MTVLVIPSEPENVAVTRPSDHCMVVCCLLLGARLNPPLSGVHRGSICVEYLTCSNILHTIASKNLDASSECAAITLVQEVTLN